jgi:DNA-binding PadR family transcriptional regulator
MRFGLGLAATARVGPRTGYRGSHCIVLRYIGPRYRVVPTVNGPRANQGHDMTSRLDRWADPPLLVLASLADEPKHGYAITRDVAETMGVMLGAGTLYAVISRLESQGLIEPLASVDRRRPYRITAAGAEALAQQSSRMSKVASLAQARLRTRLGMAGA